MAITHLKAQSYTSQTFEGIYSSQLFGQIKNWPVSGRLNNIAYHPESSLDLEYTFTRKTKKLKETTHGLQTPNEGINQRNLKNWADVADKIMLWPYLKIWDWDWDLIFGRAVKRNSSPGVRSP